MQQKENMSEKSKTRGSTSKRDDDLGLTCAICFEIYRVPKLLGCSHTFCELCIETYLIRLKDDGKLRHGFECPLCKAKTPVVAGADLVKWTKALPVNFALQAVLEAFEVKSKQTHGPNITCEGCSKIGKTSDVDMFCVQCNEYQCTNCAEHHRRFSTTSGHVIVGTAGTNIDNANSLSRKIVQYSKCDDHKKKLKFFCADHKMLCCSTCVVVLHRQCQQLEDVDAISHKQCKQNASALHRKTIEMREKVDILAAFCRKQESDMEVEIAHISSSLDIALQKIVNLFEREKGRVIEEAVKVKESKAAKLKKDFTLCKAFRDKLDEIHSILEAVRQSESEKSMFILTHRLSKEFDNQMEELSNVVNDVEVTHFQLELSDFVQTNLEHTQSIAKLGFSSSCVKSENIPDCRCHLELIVSTVINGDRKYPVLTGITHLLDGRLIAVDNARSLCIIMNCSHEVLNTIHLERAPFDIVSDRNDNIAITEGKSRTVQFYKVTTENTLDWVSTVNTPFPCDSLCYAGEKKFIIGTYQGTKPACMITRSGEVIDIVADFPERRYRFGDTKCAFILETEKLVVSACYNNSVQIFDANTKDMEMVRDSMIMEPRGIAVTKS